MPSFEHAYKGVKIRIVAGDITKLKVDAIVNPANSQMLMGGGVSGAIKRAGGAEIEAEAVKKAPVRVGEAVVTRAGRLSAKFVIHAPTMTRPAMNISVDNVQKAMRGALKSAQAFGIGSVAFSGLGTGVGGLSMEVAAGVMMKELMEHLDESSGIEEVVFVGFRDEDAEEFEKGFLRIFGNVG